MFKKLNKKGFSHHLILPVLAVFAVAGIGTYMVTKSSAYSYMSGVTPYSCPQDPPPILRSGSKGNCVKALQYRLNQWISYKRIPISKLAVDGSFGTNTRYAVIRFQKYYGLQADGVVGSKTWQKLALYCGVTKSCATK
ncbi:MAG: peptidoglycan-binding domain-containing protein [Candidatus Saccharimonadales bacterium]